MRQTHIRIQITLPKELLQEIDQLVGRKHRNEFLVAAAAEKLQREKRSGSKPFPDDR